LVLAAGCSIFLDDESGRELTIGLTTPRGIAETRERAEAWLEREDYSIVESRPGLIRAEKTPADRPIETDVLSVTLEATAEGTRVSRCRSPGQPSDASRHPAVKTGRVDQRRSRARSTR
jgi:hypothetical protein